MAAKSGALDTYFAGKEGTQVIVRYTVKGADKTASSVDDYGKDAFKVGRGTITKLDKGAHTIAIKSDDGVESTYDLTKDAAVDTEQGVVKGTEYTAKEGDKVVVHYTEDAVRKSSGFSKGVDAELSNPGAFGSSEGAGARPHGINHLSKRRRRLSVGGAACRSRPINRTGA